MNDDGPIMFYDGDCNLCNRSVQFVMKHETAPVIRFASLNGEKARQLMERQPQLTQIDSIFFLENGIIYTKSSAALRIVKYLRKPFSIFSGLEIVPLFLRDKIYDLIARNRYAWFGKTNACALPNEGQLTRMLD